MQQRSGDACNNQSKNVSGQADGSRPVSAQDPQVQSGSGQPTKPKSTQEGVDPTDIKQMQDTFDEEFQKCEKCRKPMIKGVCHRLGCGVPASKATPDSGLADDKRKKILSAKSKLQKLPKGTVVGHVRPRRCQNKECNI